jgi:hypothetical protein
MDNFRVLKFKDGLKEWVSEPTFNLERIKK